MNSRTFHVNALCAVLFIGTAILAPALQAQRVVATGSNSIAVQNLLRVATEPAAHAPAWRSAQAGIGKRQLPDARSFALARNQDASVGMGANLALMGTGGAAVVIGLLVGGNGGTAIALGGGALGLFGLYRYLR